MDGKQQKSRSSKAPNSRPHLSSRQQPQSSPIQLPSHRKHNQQSHSTPTSLPAQRPHSHSTNHSFVTTPEYQRSVAFDYDDSNSPTMPTSTLLTQLLQEKKASQLQTRLGKRNISDFEAYKRLPRTSPTDAVRPEPQRHVSLGGPTPSGSSHGKPKEMGAREMMAVSFSHFSHSSLVANHLQFIDKIKKENFDLKLQLFHQRQKRTTLEQQLEERIESMAALVEENTQLREANDRLSREVQKTQQAVDEAVAIICDHEEKLADLGLIDDDTRPSTARPDNVASEKPVSPQSNGVGASMTPTKFEVPDRGSSKRAIHSGESRGRRSATPRISKSSRRTRSFLRESSGSTSALRSIYLIDENKSKGAFSVMSMTGSMFLREDPDPETMTMDSPRLSVLSESSFMSVYGSPKHLDLNDGRPGRDDIIFSDTPLKNQRVHQWIKSREGLTDDVRRSTSISTTNETEAAPKGVSEPENDAAPAPNVPKLPKELPEAHQTPIVHKAKIPKPYKMDSPSLAGPIFSRDAALPPTPDTMSTSNPDAPNRSTSSIVAEKSLVDRAPANVGYADVLPTERPHTSDGTESRTDLGHVGEDEFYDFDEETRLGRRARRASFYQSHSFMSGGSSKAIRMLGPGAPSNPRLSCYGGNLMFNGEGIEDVVSSQYVSPNRSRSSRETAQRPARLSVELAPPLPDELFSPAPDEIPPSLPVENTSRRTSTSSGRVSFSDECKEPRPSAFRIQVPTNPQERPPVKRVSLKSRIFSRGSSSGRTSDTDSYQAAPSPSIRDGRPATATSNYRRRSSSFFGWMRTGSRDGPRAQ
jgi:hypothetical protein